MTTSISRKSDEGFSFFSTIVNLWRKADGVRRGIIGNIVCGILATAASLSFVWLTREAVDIATGRNSDYELFLVGVLLCCALFLQLLLTNISRHIEAWSIIRCSSSMRSRLFRQMLSAPFSGRRQTHSADAVNRLSSDVSTASSALCSTIPGAIITLIHLAGAFIFLSLMDFRIAVIVTAVMPAALLLGKIFMQKNRALTRKIRNEETSLHKIMQEDLQHRLLILTLGRREATADEFDECQSRFFSLSMRRNDISIFTGGAVTAGFMTGYAVMFLWCVAGLRDGTVSYAMMTAFLQLVAMVQRPAVDLSRRFSPIAQAGVALERLADIDTDAASAMCNSHLPASNFPTADNSIDKTTPDEPDKSGSSKKNLNGISFENVTFQYPDSTAPTLKNFFHTFPPDSITALCGETGAGKTTLTMLLTGAFKPSSGSIHHRCSNIVYVPQGNSLMSGTIRSNLLMGDSNATENDMRRALRISAAEFVYDLPDGVGTPCGERGHGLSEGQAQRIAIARAVLRLHYLSSRTSASSSMGIMVILDEPTSALDTETESILMDRLIPVLKGTIAIIITHNPRIIQYCTDSITIDAN